MNIVVLHNHIAARAAADAQDTLAQRDAVAGALRRRGHEVSTLACSLDLEQLRRQLSTTRLGVVFNLVESLGGTDRLMMLPPLLLDALAIPYTGASGAAILATSNKLAAKRQLRAAGLPTPDWYAAEDVASWPRSSSRGVEVPAGRDWIVKPVWEHASVGMDDDAVIEDADVATLAARVAERQVRSGRPHFAEAYIAGREFNLSLLNGRVLPPAEIEFADWPADKPRIVGYRAKWDEDSLEYRATPRRFDFPASDDGLLEELCGMARQCWDEFALRGYARVDFRVDTAGRPWILEINANPCLTPDAGFAAALKRAGIAFDAAIDETVTAALAASSLDCIASA